MNRTKFILCFITILLLSGGPILTVIAFFGWSPFGLFDPFHRWLQQRREDRYEQRW